MQSLLEQLIHSLNQQVLLHQDLLELLKEEFEKIGKHSASELMKLHAKKNQKARQIATEEEGRLQITKTLAKELGLDISQQQVTVSILVQSLSSQEGQQLQSLKNQLQELMQEISHLATRTAGIASVRLKPIEASLQFLQEQQTKRATYSVTGNIAKSSSACSRVSV